MSGRSLRLKANRKYPSIPAVGDDLRNHSQVLMAIKEAMEVGKRDTPDVLSSFVRVNDLIDLGLITLKDGAQATVGADLSQIANIGDLSGAATGDFLRFDGSDWVNEHPATLAAFGITDGATDAELAAAIAALSAVYQPLSAKLTAYAGGDTPSAFTLGIVDSADAAAWRTAIGAGTSSISALVDLTDVDITPGSGVDGYSITYDHGSGTFVLTDVTGGGVYQPLDAELSALAGLTSASDRLPYFTGSGTAALAVFTSFARALVNDVDASAARTTLSAQEHSSVLDAYAGGDTPSSFTLGIVDSASATAWRSAIGAVIGVNVQAYSAVLDAYAGGDTPSSFTLGIVDSVDAAAWRSAIGAGTSSVSTLAGLTDVNVGSPGAGQDGYSLVWDNGTSKFVLVDVSGGAGTDDQIASEVPYTNTTSGLTATDVQAAIDELTDWFIRQDSDRNLTSTTSAQNIFAPSGATSGQITLPTGTYEFFALITVINMSGTNGNANFGYGGTATTSNLTLFMVGQDVSNDNVATMSGKWRTTAAPSGSAFTAATATQLGFIVYGTVEVTATGTLIPQIALNTAATATILAGSYFKIRKRGSTGLQFKGPWT